MHRSTGSTAGEDEANSASTGEMTEQTHLQLWKGHSAPEVKCCQGGSVSLGGKWKQIRSQRKDEGTQ